jgi:AmmeMemoRadiSam system protein A
METKKSYFSNNLCAGFLLPHPPVIVPGVGKGREKKAAKTISALKKVAQEISNLRPDTVVLLSPHAPMFSDFVFMYNSAVLEGDLKQFGSSGNISFMQDTDLLTEIERLMQSAHLPGGKLDSATMRRNRLENKLDHGATVPLYYLSSLYKDFQLVAMAPSALDLQRLYQLGQLIKQAALNLNKKIVLIASGDMSHRVNEESPYGSCSEGKAFDKLIVEKLSQGDIPALFTINHSLREKASECGYRPLIVLCGAFDGQKPELQVLSYEAPFGIGYCVAEFKPHKKQNLTLNEKQKEKRESVSNVLTQLSTEQAKRNKASSIYVQIARQTLEEYVQHDRMIALKKEANQLTENTNNSENNNSNDNAIGNNNRHDYSNDKNNVQNLWTERAGVFVSLKKFGELRGCIGTTAPTTSCLAEEIRQNAISAGTKDPRFEPVTADELPFLEYSVDVLGKPQPVQNKTELDPKKFGVIVSKGLRRGLLLPDLEGVNTVEQQLDIACRKAGINPHDTYEISKFTVTRHK